MEEQEHWGDGWPEATQLGSGWPGLTAVLASGLSTTQAAPQTEQKSGTEAKSVLSESLPLATQLSQGLLATQGWDLINQGHCDK